MKSLKLKLITGLLASVGAVSASAATVTLSGTSFDVSYDDALVGLFEAYTLFEIFATARASEVVHRALFMTFLRRFVERL